MKCRVLLYQDAGDEPICDIDEILRRAETRTEDQCDEEDDGLLSSFKVEFFFWELNLELYFLSDLGEILLEMRLKKIFDLKITSFNICFLYKPLYALIQGRYSDAVSA